MRSRVVWILSGAGGDSFLGGGPSCWRELSDIPVRRLGESREHILEVRERIKPATTATLNQCVNHRTAMPLIRLANKQPVFLADSCWADRALARIVINLYGNRPRNPI